MSKLAIALNHIKARESIGFKYTVWQKAVGLYKMMFVSSIIIAAATKNILAGNVKYNKETGVVTVK